MSITATPVTPVVITTDQLRMFIRDKAEYNILIDGVQFTQAETDLAVEMAVNAYNGITPISNVTSSTFPNPYLLLLGSARFLMMSESFLQLRNQASYQSGNVAPIGIHDKSVGYQQLAAQLKAEWDEMGRAIKTQLNMESCYGTLSSGYRGIARSSHH